MSADAAPAVKPKRWPYAIALLFVLPLAVAVHSWEAVRDWLHYSDLIATHVPAGRSLDIGGAEWRLVDLQKVATSKDGAATVAAKLKAKITDAGKFAQGPCLTRAAKPGGPIWWSDSSAQDNYVNSKPELKDAKSCWRAGAAGLKAGDSITMVEAFKMPENVVDQVRLEILLPSIKPHYLVFDR